MKTSNIILLGLGVSIALVLSAGAAYGMTGQAAAQRVSASVDMMSSSMMSSSMNGGGNNNGNNNNGSISPAEMVLTALVGVVILSAGGVALTKRRKLNPS
jgi:LPXTG-motif cell wall-anchored protein